MGSSLVELERERGIATVRFNRPEKLNALSSALLHEFEARLQTIEQDQSSRVVILTGAGPKAFVAGADIGEYLDQEFDEFVAYQFYSRRLFTYLDQFPRPVIGAINGYALGGGFEIALCCDVLIASANAQFGLPEGLLGLCPGGGGTQKLTRAVGRAVASDILLSARRVPAEEAYRLGLVAETVAPDELMPAAMRKAQDMLRVAPLAAREMKRLMRTALEASPDAGLSLEQEVLFRLYQTQDAAEGLKAFGEKRTPEFKGQ